MNEHAPFIYLDYNATTPPSSGVVERMNDILENMWANPSSAHAAGLAVRDVLQKSREQVAALLDGSPSQVVFTSGGTEANNLALWSAWLRRKSGRNRLVVSSVEHPSVLQAAKSLKRFGAEVRFCGVDAAGRLLLDELARKVDRSTFLVSVMTANNEVGTLQPLGEAARIAAENGALFHSDGVQALGKLPLSLAGTGADFLSFSAHKLYGPKGVGCLCVKEGVPVVPLFDGGGQEQGARSGTENLPGIAGFAEACRQAGEALTSFEKVEALRDRLEEMLLSAAKAEIVGDPENRLPNTVAVRFKGVDSSSLLVRLSRRGVYLSAGSACHSGAQRMSHVLEAMGYTPRDASGFVRISLGTLTTEDEITRAGSIIVEEVNRRSNKTRKTQNHTTAREKGG